MTRNTAMLSSALARAFFRLGVLALLICLYPSLLLASVDWRTGSGSIAQARILPDASPVVCERVVVDRMVARRSPAYFVVSDSSKPDIRIAVLCRPPVGLRHGQALDITGTIGTLPSGERFISNPTIEGYFDRSDRPIFPPPMMIDLMPWLEKHTLAIPASPVAPADPSGQLDSAPVTAEPTPAARFDSVDSLLASAPDVLTPVELSANRIVEVGEGFIVVGDDSGGATVRVHTNAHANRDDRVLRLTGTAHTEDGRFVIYADSGPAPYFDPQGLVGSVTLAHPGTVAYAATLKDATSGEVQSAGVRSNSIGTMSVNPGQTADNAWVYLTGQVVTYIGLYYSDAIDGWVNTYNIQGIDRTPGIRVWSAWNYNPTNLGTIVDVMAKVDTKDAQRMLGVLSTDESNAVDLSSSTHCIEPNILITGAASNPLNVIPVGMTNRNLGGASMGNNPGVTGGQGLCNIGSYVTVWGKVLDAQTYWFDQLQSYGKPYMLIDDGSDANVTVFGANTFSQNDPVEVGDYLSVTGVSSIWQPSISANKYRCIWTNHLPVNLNPGMATSPQVTYGTISGTVKLYDMPTGLPNNQATVNVYCTSGQMATILATRQTDGSGSASYTFNDVPKTVDTVSPKYIISAKCDGYKTRTYTGVIPWTGTATSRNIYLTRLRKIYVMANNTNLDSCSGESNPTSTVITATVRDADHDLVTEPLTIRFRTNQGAWEEAGSDPHKCSVTTETGVATATLNAVPSEWVYGGVIVEATDDSAPLLPGDNPTDDTYNYDWLQLHDNYGQKTTITIDPPYQSLSLLPYPVSMEMCDSPQQIEATLTACGVNPGADQTIHFSTTIGAFAETARATADATTNSSGVARVTFTRSGSCGSGTITARWLSGTRVASASIPVTVDGWKLNLECSSYWTVPNSSVTVNATVKECDNTPVGPNHSVTLTTDQGHFANNQTTYTTTTNSSGEVTTTLTVTNCPVTAHVTASTIPTACTSAITTARNVRVFCETPTPCEIFFCIDSTGSMGSVDGYHRATSSVAKFLTDMKYAGVFLKVGGVKFNEPSYGYEYPYEEILTGALGQPGNQLVSLDGFQDIDGFINDWVNNTYSPNGGDYRELQLDSLHLAAQDMNAHSTTGNPNRYIVLFTDYEFHYLGDGSGFTDLTKAGMIAELENTGCKVYISLWDPDGTGLESVYTGLNVNTGEFDPTDDEYSRMEEKYPLVKLRNRIMTDWPAN